MKNVTTAAVAVLCFLWPLIIGAQCQPAVSEFPLMGPGISTVFNQGGLWIDGYVYAPNSSIANPPVTTIRSGALWMGGYDDEGKLKLASEVPGSASISPYFAGPLDLESGLPDGENCTNFDRFWPITRGEINSFLEDIADGSLDNFHFNVQSWPGRSNPLSDDNNGFELPDREFAPFVDTNSDGLYNPLDGDYPKIKGTSALYWVYNTYAEEPPISNRPQLEVHAMAHSFEVENNTMDRTTVYDFTIYNRGGVLTNFVTSLWMDPKLGCGVDDYLATLPDQQTVMIYNKDQTDGLFSCSCTGSNTYCEEPPTMGIRQLDCTEGGGKSLTSTMYYINGLDSEGLPFQVTEPLNKEQEFYFMNAQWKDGSQLTRGSAGVNQDEPTNFVFDGNPADAGSWNMCNVGVPDIDYSILLNSGPIDLETGASTQVSYAVFMVNDVALPCPDTEVVAQASTEICNFLTNVTSTQEAPTEVGLQIMPNPATHEVQIATPGTVLTFLQVFDANGRQVAHRETAPATNYTLNVAPWPKGLYFFQVMTDQGKRRSGKFLKL